jgi:hypothetical protein
VLVFTQVVPHTVCPLGQVHVPPTQVAVAGHAVPQVPQFVPLVCGFTQTPLQLLVFPVVGQHTLPIVVLPGPGATQALPLAQVSPAAHAPPAGTLVQWPAVQLAVPAGQACPQAPQLARSVCVFTQLAPHSVVGGGQVPGAHCPALHTCPATHTCPQASQLLPSVLVLTHVPPQVVKPLLQLATPQTPVVQLAVPLAGGGQAWPQLPRLVTSLLRLTQAPLQSVVPCAQLPVVQTPLWQAGAWPGGAVQTVPQPPQWKGSMAVCTQAWPQAVKAGAQAVAQEPPEQKGAAAGQRWPQAPQLEELLTKSAQPPAQGLWGAKQVWASAAGAVARRAAAAPTRPSTAPGSRRRSTVRRERPPPAAARANSSSQRSTCDSFRPPRIRPRPGTARRARWDGQPKRAL